jgi:hypothetical protein
MIVQFLIMFVAGAALMLLVGYGLFRRPVVPDWAPYFSPRQYHAFVTAVKGWFHARNVYARINDGFVVAGAQGEESQMGLSNLAQTCNLREQTEWPQIIESHFQSLTEARKLEAELQVDLKDFEKMKDLLAIRLMPMDYVQSASDAVDKLVIRDDLEDVATVLVFDLPTTVRTVSRQEAAKWGHDDLSLFQTALDNVRTNCQPQLHEETLDNGLKIWALTDESMFVATHVLLLEDHPVRIGLRGTLVGVPHRHTLLFHPINDLQTVPISTILIPMIRGMFDEGPGSVSPALYWYHDSTFTKLSYLVDKEKFTFTLPPEFTEMLDSLPE